MIFELLDLEKREIYGKEMLEMLSYSDKEFVPPLSSRTSTVQKSLSCGASNAEGVVPYFREMLQQKILGAFDKGVLQAFVSFREDYANEIITQDLQPNIYLSTLVMRPEARGKQLTVKMYNHLFNELYPSRHIFTRTWSTNWAHTVILGKFGFREICRLPDDRGPGIDTVYFGLNR